MTEKQDPGYGGTVRRREDNQQYTGPDINSPSQPWGSNLPIIPQQRGKNEDTTVPAKPKPSRSRLEKKKTGQ